MKKVKKSCLKGDFMAEYDELLDKIKNYLSNEEYIKAYFPAKDAVYRNRLNLRANYYMALSAFHINEFKEAHRYFHLLQEMQHIYKEEIVSDEVIDSYLEKIPEEDRVQWTDFPLDGTYSYSTVRENNFFGIHHLEYTAKNEDFFYGKYDWFSRFRECGTSTIPARQKTEILKVISLSDEIKMDGEQGEEVILPIVANPSQRMNDTETVSNEINISENSESKNYSFLEAGSDYFNYYRLKCPFTIKAKHPVLISNPITLKHHIGNKKLVLSIFIDSFNWKVIKETSFEELMPNTAKFFSEGTVFDNFYCGSEFTYPSVASYYTGLRSTHHKVLNLNVRFPFQLENDVITEIFHDHGYFTAKIGGDNSPECGYLRGLDRYVFDHDNQYMLAPDVIEETIDQIDAFKETDQFVYCEFLDLHHVAGHWPLNITIQTHSPCQLRAVDNEGGSSLYQTYSPNRVEVYKKQLKYLDYHLRVLFDYIKENYQKKDVVVALFSDHGNSFNMAHQVPIMSEDRINVPFMIYGGDVPTVRTDEFAESIDYRHIISKFAGIDDYRINMDDGHLPIVFGGKIEKEYIFSQSLFPNRPYSATIISKNFRYYLQSEKVVQNDCRIDLRDYSTLVIDKNGNPIEDYELMHKCLSIIKDTLGDYIIE